MTGGTGGENGLRFLNPRSNNGQYAVMHAVLRIHEPQFYLENN